MGTKKIFIESHGCSRRNAEVAKFLKYFKLNGYEIINNPEKAKYILISTCAFKKSEKEYSLKRIRTLREHKAKIFPLWMRKYVAKVLKNIIGDPKAVYNLKY
jgi:tRNA A37 methylthiotransferase MiaB